VDQDQRARSQEVVIDGWPHGKGTVLGWLDRCLVGVAGPAGSSTADELGLGFTTAGMRDLTLQLRVLEQPGSPFVQRVPSGYLRGARWVRPVLTGEVTYTEWTPAGLRCYSAATTLAGSACARSGQILVGNDAELGRADSQLLTRRWAAALDVYRYVTEPRDGGAVVSVTCDEEVTQGLAAEDDDAARSMRRQPDDARHRPARPQGRGRR
jgi:ATP dependent DNA ligase C terminal region